MRDRHIHLRRVGEEGVAVAIGEPRGLDVAVQAFRRGRALRHGVEAVQDVQDLEHDHARAVRRALEHLDIAPFGR